MQSRDMMVRRLSGGLIGKRIMQFLQYLSLPADGDMKPISPLTLFLHSGHFLVVVSEADPSYRVGDVGVTGLT